MPNNILMDSDFGDQKLPRKQPRSINRDEARALVIVSGAQERPDASGSSEVSSNALSDTTES